MGVDHVHNFSHEQGGFGVGGNDHIGLEVGPFFFNFDFDQGVGTLVHSFVVHPNHFVALLTVGLLDGVFHVSHGFSVRNDVGEFKESGLEDGVGSSGHSQVFGDLGGVQDVELNVVVSHLFFHIVWKVFYRVLGTVKGVQEECSAVFNSPEHIVLVQVGGLGTGNEIRAVDQVGGTDEFFTEP